MKKNNATASTDFYSLWQDYYWFLTKYRLSTGDLPEGYSSPEDFVRKAEKYFKDPRVSAVKIPYWYKGFDENGNVIHDDKNEQLATLLKEKGYTEKSYYYLGGLIDEPADTPERNKMVHTLCEDIRSYTDMIHVVTVEPRASLLGVVDDWCPTWHNVTEKEIRERQELGDYFWWYGCVVPQYPYPTYHIPDRTLSSRLVMWMQKDYNVEGVLYWASALMSKYDDTQNKYVSRDIWTDPFAFPNAAGDGFLVYAGTENDGIINKNIPVPTIRLESIRDGAEDYEYLLMVENKYKQLIEKYNLDLDIIDIMKEFYTPLYANIGNFETNPERLQQMREVLANEILSDDNAIISVLPNLISETAEGREVRVYAEKGSSVIIDGKLVEGTDLGGCEIFSSTVFADHARTVDISVNGVRHDRIICNPSVAEYKSIAQKLIEENSASDVIINEIETSYSQFTIKIFAPENSTVTVNGNDTTQKTDYKGAKYYEYNLNVQNKTAVYNVAVTIGDNTRTFKRLAVNIITRRVDVLDLYNPQTIESIKQISTNKFGTSTNIMDFNDNKALNLTFAKGAMVRFILKTDEIKNVGSLSNYTHIRVTVTNPSETYNSGIAATINYGSASVVCDGVCDLEANETRVFDFKIPRNSFGEPEISAIDTIKLVIYDNSIEQHYIVSGIELISK